MKVEAQKAVVLDSAPKQLDWIQESSEAPGTSSLEMKCRIANNLLAQDYKAQETILFIVYQTIRANSGITLNQLRWLLFNEYLFTEASTTAAVGVLSSSTLFGAVHKWWATDKPDVIRLKARARCSCNGDEEAHSSQDNQFCKYLQTLYAHSPELAQFVAPVFKKKNKE